MQRTCLFEDYSTLNWNDVFPISVEHTLALPPGHVVLVRSNRVPDLGDHFALITGAPIQKPWGLAPEVVVYPAPSLRAKSLLDQYSTGDITVLALNPEIERMFKSFHNIKTPIS